MSSISFSIIIPLYNKSRTITQTLDSVCSLAWDHYEVVVVDDGSTDDSPEIVNSYSSERIKLYRKTNGGVSSARNYGAQKASNPWLIFLDADDLLFPEALQVFGDLIERYPRDEVFVGNFQYKRNENMVTRYCRKEFVSEHPSRDIWLFHIYMRPGSFCINTHSFSISGGYDERMSFNEDFEYCMRLAQLFRIVSTPKMVMEYVTDENEARKKIHPLENNFCYYIPYMNITDSFVRYGYYQRLLVSIKRYKENNETHAFNTLTEIKRSKFGLVYSLKAWIMHRTLITIFRIRSLRKNKRIIEI